MTPATSARDPRIVRAARLLRAPADGAFVVDGPELLAEARAVRAEALCQELRVFRARPGGGVVEV